MPLRVRINNQNKKRGINQKVIKKSVLHILRSFRKNNALIDITFVGNKKIKKLNKKYMRRDCATDVLSFLLEEAAIVGDIYISTDMACENAKRFKTNYRKELLLYTIHGVLHLLGFGDKTRKEKSRIRKLETKFFRKLWHNKIS